MRHEAGTDRTKHFLCQTPSPPPILLHIPNSIFVSRNNSSKWPYCMLSVKITLFLLKLLQSISKIDTSVKGMPFNSPNFTYRVCYPGQCVDSLIHKIFKNCLDAPNQVVYVIKLFSFIQVSHTLGAIPSFIIFLIGLHRFQNIFLNI